MKKNKIILKITKILAIIAISLIAFVGIYMQKANRMENIVKDYQYSMDLEGRRIISLKVNSDKETIIKDSEGNEVEEELTDEQIAEKGYTKEEKAYNGQEVLTLENYEKTKKILEKRLKKLGVNNFTIRLDNSTGTIYLEIPEDKTTDHTVSNISEIGKFEILDEETQEVLLNNNQLDKVQVLYSTETDGTVVYLNMKFNKEGKEKLNEISKTYVETEVTKETENTTSEENSTTAEQTNVEDNTTTQENATEQNTTEESTQETETVEKKVTLQIDGSEMITTSFDQPIENGQIQLSMGVATTDKETLNDTIEKATTIATILDNGKLPIKYDIDENKYVGTDLTKDIMQKIVIASAIVLALALIVLVIKYKSKGLLASISFIGFVAIYTLVIRYTNVLVTLNSLIAMGIVVLMNYLFNITILSKLQKEKTINLTMKESYKEFFVKMIPAIIISVAFSFIKWIPVSSFGMTMMWGIVIIAIYNILITRGLIKN